MNALQAGLLLLKGMAMGAANVIPGVSGGTIAFVTGIFDDLIQSLKRLDFKAIKLLFTGKFKALSEYVNVPFLFFLFLGVGISLVSLGKLLGYLFENYPIPVWAFFFGLIIASVWIVGKQIKTWGAPALLGIVFGTAAAASLMLLPPASENTAFVYLILCGVAAMASMLLPGLSGSFVLILLGNYQLIMLDAVPELNLKIIAPVAIGAVLGLIILSRGIDFLLKKAPDLTVGILTGFVLGSLVLIWPWKTEVFLTDPVGEPLLRKGQPIVETYERYLPNFGEASTLYALGLMAAGLVLVLLIDWIGNRAQRKRA